MILNICHVTSSISRIGAGVSQVIRDMTSVQSPFNNIKIFTLLDEYTNIDLTVTDRIKVFATPISALRKFGYSATLFDTINNQTTDTDIMHMHGLWMYPNWAAGTVARTKSIPYVISPHGMLDPRSLRMNAWKKSIVKYLFEKKNIDNVSCIQACSELEAGHFRSYGYSGPIAVIKSGISQTALDAAKKQPTSNLANRYQHLSDKKIMLYLSRLHEQKGPEILLNAWQYLFRGNQDWHLVVSGYGDDSYIQGLRKLVSDNGMEHVVTFTGPVYDSDKWDLLKAADLFILPSFSENFGLVIAESLAAGTPVITTKGTPWAELETTNCGWWIDIGVAPLIEAIQSAISMSASERLAMGQRGCEYVSRELNWNVIGEKTLSLYTWILHGGTPPEFVRLD